jgi:peptidoglycan/LPS O-acetylase OafA/YrhL
MSAETLINKKRSSRVSSVEFWRFVFTVLVCIYHLEISFIKGKHLPSGTAAVEFFFILAGFLIAMSASHSLSGRTDKVTTKEAAAKAVDFVWKKVKAIYPILIVALILHYAIPSSSTFSFGQETSKISQILNSEWDLLFMTGTPFGYNNGMTAIVPLWFLTALLVVGYIYTFAVYRNYDLTMFLAPVLGVLFLTYFGLKSSLILDFNIQMGFLTAGMVRAFAEMALGIAIFGLYSHLSKKKLGAFWIVMLTLLEIYAIYRYFALTIDQPAGLDNFRRIVYIMIIILLSFMNVGQVSRIFNNPFSRWLGSISLAMYLCHYPLVSFYFNVLNAVKAKYTTGALADFVSDMGGYSGWSSIPMTWKDRLVYILIVIIFSAILTLLINICKKLISSRRIKETEKTEVTAGV